MWCGRRWPYWHMNRQHVSTSSAVTLISGLLCLLLESEEFCARLCCGACSFWVVSAPKANKTFRQTKKKTLSNWLVVTCFSKQSFASFAWIIHCWEKPRRQANNALYSLRSCNDQEHRRTHAMSKCSQFPHFFFFFNLGRYESGTPPHSFLTQPFTVLNDSPCKNAAAWNHDLCKLWCSRPRWKNDPVKSSFQSHPEACGHLRGGGVGVWRWMA